ncbi:MAG TPA: nucleotidyltransferase family protein [Paludibaculum sp.]
MILPHPHFASILLAAGASSRMGRPKPLLDYHGETFLDTQIALHCACSGQVFVVLGNHAAEIAAGAKRTENAVLLLNPDPDRGQLSSLQCGLNALPSHIHGVFIQPVDSPGVAPATLLAMCQAWDTAAAPPDFVIPTHDGRRGHPVLMRSAICGELLALTGSATARDVVHAHRATTLFIDTADSAIHRDIDTPQDYEQLIAGVYP